MCDEWAKWGMRGVTNGENWVRDYYHYVVGAAIDEYVERRVITHSHQIDHTIRSGGHLLA